jgi:hypothetical protein
MAGGAGGMAGGAGGMAGGTGGMAGAGGTAPRATVCAEYAASRAAKLMQCAPFIVRVSYGTEANYRNRVQLNCMNYDLPGVNWPRWPHKPCADAVAAQSCMDFFDGIDPPACQAAGVLGPGARCAAGDQCSTGFCDLPDTGGTCGLCVRLPTAGQDCLEGEYCSPGLACSFDETCVTPASAGERCGDDRPCRSTLYCRNGQCAPLLRQGEPCQFDGQCDYYAGVVCRDNVCVQRVLGPTCAPTAAPNTVATCEAGGTCNRTTSACAPAAADGAACNDDTGPLCVWPARCGSDGRCRAYVPDRACTPSARRLDDTLRRQLERDLGPRGARARDAWSPATGRLGDGR